MKKGLIQVYTGNGKGKTTSAFGLALRASGHNFKSLILQFLKPTDCLSGEVTALSDNKNITVKRFGSSKVLGCLRPKKQYDDKTKEYCQEAIGFLNSTDLSVYDLVVLDEIACAINHNLVAVNQVIDILKNKPQTTEIILTGRNMPKEIIDIADLVSEINEVKHPYKQDIVARKGIEY
jgi:cob(I)alamin adenosyltransferase